MQINSNLFRISEEFYHIKSLYHHNASLICKISAPNFRMIFLNSKYTLIKTYITLKHFLNNYFHLFIFHLRNFYKILKLPNQIGYHIFFSFLTPRTMIAFITNIGADIWSGSRTCIVVFVYFSMLVKNTI